MRALEDVVICCHKCCGVEKHLFFHTKKGAPRSTVTFLRLIEKWMNNDPLFVLYLLSLFEQYLPVLPHHSY